MTGIHRLPAGAEDRVNGLVRAEPRDRRPRGDDRPARAAPAGERDERARARRRLALHAVRQPGLADDRAARRGADRDGARPGARGPRPRRPGARRDPLRLRDRLGHVRDPPRDLPDPGPRLRQPARARPTPGSCRGRWPSWRRAPPSEIGALAEALGTEPERIEERILELGGDPPGLGSVGADRERLDEALEAILERPELGFTPEPAEPRGADRADRTGLVAAGVLAAGNRAGAATCSPSG